MVITELTDRAMHADLQKVLPPCECKYNASTNWFNQSMFVFYEVLLFVISRWALSFCQLTSVIIIDLLIYLKRAALD